MGLCGFGLIFEIGVSRQEARGSLDRKGDFGFGEVECVDGDGDGDGDDDGDYDIYKLERL